MIDYGIFQFASPPRTATTWFRKVAFRAGLGEMSAAGIHTPHEPRGDVLRVSVVRHPADWLRSYYTTIQGGHVGVGCVDKFMNLAKRSDCLNDFLVSYLAELPGAVGWMFDAYNADTILKIEDLPWAMQGVLEGAGVKRSQAHKAIEISPQNVSRGVMPIMSPILRRDVVAAEADFCSEYEYWE